MTPRLYFALAIALMTIANAANAANVFVCQDGRGVVSNSNKPCPEGSKPIDRYRDIKKTKPQAPGLQPLANFREIQVWLYVEDDGDGYCYWGWSLTPAFIDKVDTIDMNFAADKPINESDLVRPRYFPAQVFMLSHGVEYVFSDVKIIPAADPDLGCRFEAQVRRTVHRRFPGFFFETGPMWVVR